MVSLANKDTLSWPGNFKIEEVFELFEILQLKLTVKEDFQIFNNFAIIIGDVNVINIH